jgi:hypothetical protein
MEVSYQELLLVKVQLDEDQLMELLVLQDEELQYHLHEIEHWIEDELNQVLKLEVLEVLIDLMNQHEQYNGKIYW